MATRTFGLQKVLQREYAIVVACLALVIVLSWLYILSGAGMQMAMTEMTRARSVWDVAYGLLIFFMWWVMMVAMMLPSAAPMILLFSFLNRKTGEGSLLSVGAFISAYVFVWGGFSAIETSLQWWLGETTLLSPRMSSGNLIFGGALLIAAGVWQLTPLKHSCLRHCRAPIHYFAHGWRTGAGGAFAMGVVHGAYVVGY